MPKEFTTFFRKLFDLREGAEDKATIIENVKDDSDFSSARFWTLVCAIVVASIGLNINSVPVVIGAMLISPLTGPIVSIGLALSINDWGLMRRSARNLLILTTISIGISALYFALSPIENAQSELLSRIRPTIFDVLIAVFGGVAGFIGISRARHGNIIPGVAIATAIMPPLCTVGYGISTMQPKFIFGAFYLFLINCIFICLSALVVAKYMKLPKRDYPEETTRRKVRRIITLIIFIIVSPAIYLAFTFVEQNNFYLNAENFVRTNFTDQGHVIIYKNIVYKSPDNLIELAFLSNQFSPEEIAEFESRLTASKLKNTKLLIRKNGSYPDEETTNSRLDDTTVRQQLLQDQLVSELNKQKSPDVILSEIRALDSRITEISIGALTSSTNNQQSVIFIYTDSNAQSLTDEESQSLTSWLKVRLDNPDLIIHFNPLIPR